MAEERRLFGIPASVLAGVRLPMKNVQIEVWRFAFAIYMVIYHTLGHVYGVRTGGYIGVDVFFIISGYFLASSHEKELARGGAHLACYLKNRFFRLWPMYLCAFLICAVQQGICAQKSPGWILERIYRGFPEALMLRVKVSVNGLAWFVEAMLIAGVLLWVCLTIDKNHVLRNCALPVCAILIYNRFETVAGRIHFTTTQTVFTLGVDGIWRAIAGMSLGMLAFAIVQGTSQYTLTDAAELGLSLLGNIGMVSIVGISVFKYHGFCDFGFIFLAFLSVICVSRAKLVKIDKNVQYIYCTKAICRLGALAYPIYLLHQAVFDVVKTYKLIQSPALGCVFVILVTMLEALALNWLLEKVSFLW